MSRDLEDDLMCNICHDLAELPVSTTCCNQIFCQECIRCHQQIHPNVCPYCRQSVRTRRNIPFERIVMSYREGRYGTPLQEDHHNYHHTCRDCDFKGSRGACLEHVVNEHPERVLSVTQDIRAQHIMGFVNDEGRATLIGRTGKFYCSVLVEVAHSRHVCCSCTPRCFQGSGCGPSTGCNCASCMRLDIQLRRAGPVIPAEVIFLVNRTGRLATYHSESATFSCGRKYYDRSRRKSMECKPGSPCLACCVLNHEQGHYFQNPNNFSETP